MVYREESIPEKMKQESVFFGLLRLIGGILYLPKYESVMKFLRGALVVSCFIYFIFGIPITAITLVAVFIPSVTSIIISIILGVSWGIWVCKGINNYMENKPNPPDGKKDSMNNFIDHGKLTRDEYGTIIW